MYSFSRAKKKIFVSFNYTDDNTYRNLLSALSKNTGSEVEFEDYTPSEIKSKSVDRVKAVLTGKIRDSDYTLVIVGENANEQHPDHKEIGTRNWQWWEIEKADEEDHKFIAVKLDPSYDSPTPLLGKGAKYARSFKTDSIVKAINEA